MWGEIGRRSDERCGNGAEWWTKAETAPLCYKPLAFVALTATAARLLSLLHSRLYQASTKRLLKVYFKSSFEVIQ